MKHVDTRLEQTSFDKLVASLTDTLGPSSGLTLDDVDVTSLMCLMKLYDSQDRDWAKYAFGDSDADYTRNLVDEGNGKSNLLVLVWSPGKGSPIHDHGNAHCLMKILKGNLTETRYAFPQQGHGHPLEIISGTTHSENEVVYMADELGLHQMSNKGSDFAVSLHLYTPPHVARKGCCIFDERTGKKNYVSGDSYHSAYGRLLKN
ncbi:cysteine dioxygenase [Truncatella angustata]|uniref:Cysteine dioxygenase n=1 Tax=Truncatella angustata TaxID=152316 RepID=A0A9P8RL75_9PEZI|nr:cysteine dioxygenase [Truncatella angustata]KAH6645345.1 cysteine dioxygenase [Truncatella angustata]